MDILSFSSPEPFAGVKCQPDSCHSPQNSSEPRAGMINEVIPIYTHVSARANHTGAVSATQISAV